MKINIDVLRRPRNESASFWQTFMYETDDDTETVATALTALQGRPNLSDADGNQARPIQWECSCLQKKCGACAMVINGKPALACSVKLLSAGETIRLEPLKKFPVIEDLITDRSILYQNLETLHLWFEDDARTNEGSMDCAFEGSRCLQCGCCLEVCPNFIPRGSFTGMASAVPISRILAEMSGAQRKKATRLYQKHIYEGCGKSLSCQNHCPANIEIDKLLVNSNAIAVWKRFFN